MLNLYDLDLAELARERWAEFGRQHRIRVIWGCDIPDDLAATHPYGGAHTLYSGQSNDAARIEGERWIDLWRAGDKILTGHRTEQVILGFDNEAGPNGHLKLLHQQHQRRAEEG